MTDSATTDPILALAERVEAAPEGGVMRDNLRREILRTVAVELAYHWEYPNGTRIENVDILNSLDAIAALQEAVLPGWRTVSLVEWPRTKMWEIVLGSRDRDLPYARATAPTEPAARLAALLRAVAMERRTLQGDHHDR